MVVLSGLATAAPAYVNFETGHVRPLAFVDATTDLLLAVDTPDDRLAIYVVGAGGLTLAADVPVGLQPVAVAARVRMDGSVQAFVVNHLSDSVSVVMVDPLNPSAARVVRTLHVGDEPRDVVVAGPFRRRIFVTAAHRGQNRPGDPALLTEGVGRADVWVFNAENLGAPLGGTPITVLNLPGDTPRALAVTPNGRTVYAAVFHSGNRTTVIPESTVRSHGGLPPIPPAGVTPCIVTTTTLPMQPAPPAPSTGLIVRQTAATGQWIDEAWHDWSTDVPFTLPDADVFRIDAAAQPPAPSGAIAGAGTVLFNMAVRPGTGALYVTNTEARNHVRFEPCLRGHVAESRITVVHGTTATPVHLNPHVEYGLIPGPPGEAAQTLAMPTDLAFSSDGRTVFVTALGSPHLGILDTSRLEAGDVLPRELVTVGVGASGVVLDDARNRLYVMNRFENTITIVDGASTPGGRTVAGTVALPYSPEPAFIGAGRRFLYDARETSAHGDLSCASCHVYGDTDGLAWDLGDPGGAVRGNPNRSTITNGLVGGTFHPLKGPMATQSLRGMAGAGPLHWRGDRTGAAEPGGSETDVHAAFVQFNGAFPLLLGRASRLADADMQAFADFALTIRYPPNPIAPLDDVPTADEAAGKLLFDTGNLDGVDCVTCHAHPLGTDGLSLAGVLPQTFKVAHLRNLYQKVGRFGMPTDADLGIPDYTVGAQVRGFGLLHDGGISSVFDFLRAGVFAFANDDERRQVAAFLLAFDTGFAPAVGQQVTVTPASVADPAIAARIALLLARSDAARCDLVVKGRLAGQLRGWVHEKSTGTFSTDEAGEPAIAEAALRAQAATSGQERTYTCVPPGEGVRSGIDRDFDGVRDGDDAVLDPPTTTTTTSTSSSTSTSTTTTSTSTTRPPFTLRTIPPVPTHTLFNIPIPLGDPPPFRPGQAPRVH